MFKIGHFSSLFFIKTKDEKLPAFVCLFVCFFLFMEIMHDGQLLRKMLPFVRAQNRQR